MITTNMIEIWKVENAQEYARIVERSGYDKAQEIVRNHLQSMFDHVAFLRRVGTAHE